MLRRCAFKGCRKKTDQWLEDGWSNLAYWDDPNIPDPATTALHMLLRLSMRKPAVSWMRQWIVSVGVSRKPDANEGTGELSPPRSFLCLFAPPGSK